MNPKLFTFRKHPTAGYTLYAIKQDSPPTEYLVAQYPFQGYWATSKVLMLAGCKLGQASVQDLSTLRKMDDVHLWEITDDLLDAIKAQNKIPRRTNQERRQQAFRALARLIGYVVQSNDKKPKRPPKVTRETREHVKKTLRREVGKVNSVWVEWEAERKAEDLAYKARLKSLTF